MTGENKCYFCGEKSGGLEYAAEETGYEPLPVCGDCFEETYDNNVGRLGAHGLPPNAIDKEGRGFAMAIGLEMAATGKGAGDSLERLREAEEIRIESEKKKFNAFAERIGITPEELEEKAPQLSPKRFFNRK